MKKRQGFTLIELLIVVSIIGILSVALVPNLTGAPQRARDATRKAMLSEVAAALESYNIDNGEYPDLNAPASSTEGAACINGEDDTATFVSTYLKNNPPSAQANPGNTGCPEHVKYIKLTDGYVIYINLETGLGGEFDFAGLDALTEAADVAAALNERDGTTAHAIVR